MLHIMVTEAVSEHSVMAIKAIQVSAPPWPPYFPESSDLLWCLVVNSSVGSVLMVPNSTGSTMASSSPLDLFTTPRYMVSSTAPQPSQAHYCSSVQANLYMMFTYFILKFS